MNILFLSHFFHPHIGGVEIHTLNVASELIKKGHSVTVITQRYDSKLLDNQTVDGIKIIRFSYPQLKIVGLFSIWLWFLKNYKLVKNADIVHCHDIFIWCLPFKIVFPFKKVYTTFHGWEGVYPIPLKNKILKIIASKLSTGSISIGKYISKYYGIKSNFIVYGGSNVTSKKYTKNKNTIAFVGRLESDTGVLDFLKYLKNKKYKKVDFVGDGSLKNECSRFGMVRGFVNPEPFLKNAEYAVPAGYLSYIEAKSYGCKIITFYQNNLKKDYWEEIKKVNKFPTWSQISQEYLKLWANNI